MHLRVFCQHLDAFCTKGGQLNDGWNFKRNDTPETIDFPQGGLFQNSIFSSLSADSLSRHYLGTLARPAPTLLLSLLARLRAPSHSLTHSPGAAANFLEFFYVARACEKICRLLQTFCAKGARVCCESFLKSLHAQDFFQSLFKAARAEVYKSKCLKNARP